MATYDSRVFLGSSGGTAMLDREARARRQAPPQAILRRSPGLRGGNCARRGLHSTTKEEGDWASTSGEETDCTLPEREVSVFQISTASCEQPFCLARGRSTTDWNWPSTRASAKQRAEWAKAMRRLWRTTTGGWQTESHDPHPHRHRESNDRLFNGFFTRQ